MNLAQKLKNIESLDNEIFFSHYNGETLSDILPYINEWEKKGLLFEFSLKPKENECLEDADHKIIFISKEKYLAKKVQEEKIALFYKKVKSEICKQWFEKNFLQKPFFQEMKVFHVIDYFNQVEKELTHWQSQDNDEARRYVSTINKQIKRLNTASFDEIYRWTEFWNKRVSKREENEDSNALCVIYQNDQYKVVQLRSEQSKRREGYLMSHCVGEGYSSSFIFSVRDYQDNSYATIELNNGRVQQIKGKENEAVDFKCWGFIREFIAHFKIKLDDCEDLENIGFRSFLVKIIEPQYSNFTDVYFYHDKDVCLSRIDLEIDESTTLGSLIQESLYEIPKSLKNEYVDFINKKFMMYNNRICSKNVVDLFKIYQKQVKGIERNKLELVFKENAISYATFETGVQYNVKGVYYDEGDLGIESPIYSLLAKYSSLTALVNQCLMTNEDDFVFLSQLNKRRSKWGHMVSKDYEQLFKHYEGLHRFYSEHMHELINICIQKEYNSNLLNKIAIKNQVSYWLEKNKKKIESLYKQEDFDYDKIYDEELREHPLVRRKLENLSLQKSFRKFLDYLNDFAIKLQEE